MSKTGYGYPTNTVTVASPPSYAACSSACLSLSLTDRIQIIQFPMQIIDVIRQTIRASWRRGIQGEKPIAGAYEFKLYGNPWCISTGDESIEARVLLMSILSALHHQGWHLALTTGVCKGDTQVDTLIFQPSVIPSSTSFFAVSFSEGDKLRFIGAPSEILSAISEAIGAHEIQSTEWICTNIAYQFKLRGYPWTGKGDETISSRLKLLTLLNCFSVFGWQLHASINFSIQAESSEADTWFFRRVNQ